VSLIAILALPLLAAAACWLLRNERLAPILTVASCLAVLALAIHVALLAANGESMIAIPNFVAVDSLSALIVLLIALVGTTAGVFSWGYMAKTTPDRSRLRVYYANYNLFIFSMLAIPLSVEPTLVWIFVELTTLSSAMLVSFENTHAALEAAWKYVTLSLMGAAIALLGFLLLFAAMQAAGGGTYTWDGLLAAAPRMPPALLQTAFLLILVGFGTKVGLVPLHTWLPDAHSQAPSPVCALLSGIETTAVLYVILRLLPVLKAAPLPHLELWTVMFGLVSVGTAAFLLLQVRDYKRLFAYSTVEHMGIILVSAGFASSAAHYATMYQILSHTLTKSFCFFAAGAALLAVETREIASVRGLIRTSPAAGASLLLGGLAIAGAPPFAVFLSEFSIFKAGLVEEHYVATGLLVLFVAIGFFGILLHINRMVFGCPHGDLPATAPLPVSCIAVLVVAGVLVIALGLYLPAPLHDLLRLAAATLDR
jgi:hydrogenase-4 component F